MNKETAEAIRKLNDAIERLKEGVRESSSDLECDGTIQRFEFTFELFWKAIKVCLQQKGVLVQTPRDALKEAFRLQLITQEKKFSEMLDDRNITTHIYDKEESRKIFAKIKKNYFPLIQETVRKLNKMV